MTNVVGYTSRGEGRVRVRVRGRVRVKGRVRGGVGVWTDLLKGTWG